MPEVYLALGSNIEDKYSNLIRAKELLSERVGEVLALSSFYEAEPWGFDSENHFLNAVILVASSLPPFEILDITQRIEDEMGRTRSNDGFYHDRIIDIDLLLYGGLALRESRLAIPHPLMQERAFVMKPLAEIAPALVHPVLGKTMSELAAETTAQACCCNRLYPQK